MHEKACLQLQDISSCNSSRVKKTGSYTDKPTNPRVVLGNIMGGLPASTKQPEPIQPNNRQPFWLPVYEPASLAHGSSPVLRDVFPHPATLQHHPHAYAQLYAAYLSKALFQGSIGPLVNQKKKWLANSLSLLGYINTRLFLSTCATFSWLPPIPHQWFFLVGI